MLEKLEKDAIDYKHAEINRTHERAEGQRPKTIVNKWEGKANAKD